MHTPFRFLSFAVALVGLLAGSHSLAAERADILLHRQAPGRLFGAPSDTAYIDDFESATSALAADQFSLPTEASICKITAFAFFGGSSPLLDPGPPQVQTLRARIYADAAGLPGVAAMEQYFTNPPPTWTGSYVALGPLRKEYAYQLNLPTCFTADANAPYWIELSQIGDTESLLRWENSSVAGGFAEQFPIGAQWRSTSPTRGQLAYELWTPEPCSGALLALAFAFLLKNPAR